MSAASGGYGVPSADGLRYDELHRLGPPALWRPLVGVPTIVGLLLASQLVLGALLAGALVATGLSLEDATARLDGSPVTPSFLALVNLGWAMAIPAVLVVALVLHRQSAGLVASVAGRIRWRWLAVCLGLSLAALVATLAVAALLPAQDAAGVEMDGSLNAWSDRTRDFVLVVLLLTPLQAAGEEYAFRGYLTQAVGGVAGRLGDRVGVTVAVVVPALLFALAHGIGQDLPIFFDRFAFGVVAGVLVVLTGGLEAGIAMHVLNNFAAYALALAYGDMDTALSPTGGTWWSIATTLTQSVSYLVLALLVSRAIGLETRSGRGILEPRRHPL